MCPHCPPAALHADWLAGFRLVAACIAATWHAQDEDEEVDKVHYPFKPKCVCRLFVESVEQAGLQWQSDCLLYSPISCVNHIILFQIYKCELVFWFSANEHHTLISKCRAKQKVQERCQSTSKLTTPLLYVSSSLPIKSHMLWYTSTRYSIALLGLINPFKNCFRLIEMLFFAPVNEN